MKLKVLAVGQKMPAWVMTGYQEYQKRMPRECSLEVVEIAPAKRTKSKIIKAGDIQKIIEDESKRILANIKPDDYVVALDLSGKNWSTSELSKKLESWQGFHARVIFLIGGPDGLSPACLQRANAKWCLSALTFPHPLVRVILAEQLYRGWSLMNNHPYHRE